MAYLDCKVVPGRWIRGSSPEEVVGLNPPPSAALEQLAAWAVQVDFAERRAIWKDYAVVRGAFFSTTFSG
jgi:hypothetical protein